MQSLNSKFVSDFCSKTNLLNDFFTSICTPINNGSVLPPFACKANAKITSFCVTQNDISLKMKTLDPRKAHGFDNNSVKTETINVSTIAVIHFFFLNGYLSEAYVIDIKYIKMTGLQDFS